MTELHCMAENCQFGQINHDLIRDRLVVGLRDTKLAGRFSVGPGVDFGKSCKPGHAI